MRHPIPEAVIQSSLTKSARLDTSNGSPGGVMDWALVSLSANSRFRRRREARGVFLLLRPIRGADDGVEGGLGVAKAVGAGGFEGAIEVAQGPAVGGHDFAAQGAQGNSGFGDCFNLGERGRLCNAFSGCTSLEINSNAGRLVTPGHAM